MNLKKSLLFTFFTAHFLINPSYATGNGIDKIKQLKEQQKKCLTSLTIALGISGAAFGAALVFNYFVSDQAKQAYSLDSIISKANKFKNLSLQALENHQSTRYHLYNDLYEQYNAEQKALINYTPPLQDNALSTASSASYAISFASLCTGIINGITYYNLSQKIKELESINNKE